jgi:hypothetical protein
VWAPWETWLLGRHGFHNSTRVLGVTTLDAVGASSFTANALNRDDPQTFIIGGHTGAIILPLVNQPRPKVNPTKEQRDTVTYHKSCREKRRLLPSPYGFACANRRVVDIISSVIHVARRPRFGCRQQPIRVS